MINDALPAATRSDLHIFAAVVGIMLLDGVKHVVVTTLFRNYTPGVITAVLVEIPYAAWMLHQMFNEKLIDLRS